MDCHKLKKRTAIIRPFPAFLVFLIAFFSCSGDDPVLSPNLVSDLRAYDLGNNGNGSDIRIHFIVENNLNVIEYRVVVLPAAGSSAFDPGVAESIPDESYVRLQPEPFVLEYSINRLPSVALDINGSTLANNTEYVAAIYIIGDGSRQLSGFSRTFTLLDRGIYSGVYEVSQERRLDSAIIVLIGDSYEGPVYGDHPGSQVSSGGPNCDPVFPPFSDLGDLSLQISENIVTEFIWNEPNINDDSPNSCFVESIPRSGDGEILDELIITIETPFGAVLMELKRL